MCNYFLVVQGLLQHFEFHAMFGGLKEGRREETPAEAVNTLLESCPIAEWRKINQM